MRKAQLWIVLAMVSLVVWGMGLSAFAEPKPSDYLGEVLAGLFGTVLGGAGGFIAGFDADELFCSVTKRTCGLEEQGGVGFIGVFLTAPIGATTLVMTTAHGGNYWLSLAGAYVGELIFWIGAILYSQLPSTLQEFLSDGRIIFALFCGTITAGAVIGYNWGAKMKSDKSKPAALSWSLPLVQLRF